MREFGIHLTLCVCVPDKNNSRNISCCFDFESRLQLSYCSVGYFPSLLCVNCGSVGWKRIISCWTSVDFIYCACNGGFARKKLQQELGATRVKEWHVDVFYLFKHTVFKYLSSLSEEEGLHLRVLQVYWESFCIRESLCHLSKVNIWWEMTPLILNGYWYYVCAAIEQNIFLL